MNADVRIEALFSAGYEFQRVGEFEKAIGAYREVLRRVPHHVRSHNNLGNCLRHTGCFEDSLVHYDAALDLEPGRDSTLLNRSLALLALNRYEEAWPLYEKRFSTIDYRSEIRSTGKPEWNGESLEGDQLLFLYSNQGLGDELQMLRYLPFVRERVSRIRLEIQAPNLGIFRGMEGIEEIQVRPRERSVPPHDYHCELFSLPGVLGTSFQRLPPPLRPPYEPDAAVRSRIETERKRFPDRRHIGLVWSGNPRNEMNPFRACGLIHYLPLLGLPGTRFYSLQKGAPAKDIEKFNVGSDLLVDLADDLTEMAATATAIDALDLVITTDTSVAHLAGTLGARSWVLLHRPSDWRWTLGGDETPWYPLLRLFRQDRPRVWKPLIAEVASEILKL